MNELEELAATSPIEKSEAQKIAADFNQFADKLDGWQQEANQIVIVSIEDKEQMLAARTLRLRVRDARINVEKTHKVWKQDVLDRGRLIDACKNLAVGLIKPIEQELKDKEDFALKQEQVRIAHLVTERKERLAGLSYPGQEYPDLSLMDDDTFETYFEGVKTRHTNHVEEQKAKEQARLDAEKAEREKQERIAKENETLKAEAIQKEKDHRATLEAQAKQEAAKLAKIESKAKEERQAAEKKAADEVARRQEEQVAAEVQAHKEAAEKALIDSLNRENNLAAFRVLLVNHCERNGGDPKYIMEKANRYLEGRDTGDWRWGLDTINYKAAGLPPESYMGADLEEEDDQ